MISDASLILPNGNLCKLHYHRSGYIYLFSSDANAFTGIILDQLTAIYATANGIRYYLPLYSRTIQPLSGGSSIVFSYNLQGLGYVGPHLTAGSAKFVTIIEIIQQ